VHPGISRRGVLRAAVAAVGLAGVGATAGCDLFGGGDSDDIVVAPEHAELLAGTVALGDAYDDAISRVPSLTAQLTGPRDAHRAHAEALARALATSVPSSNSTAGGGADPAATLTALAEMENRGLEAAREVCLSAPDRLASLVGTIAAARACHLEVLR
jgi:hypothetical protein